ncbi:hypothetical protein Cgig2_017996 [Carnegiea gigantea]|uniref:Uncharacterized protein n=1 Tax=Carnegiea gigantea TaxID=171969 RepID=A0A9Q1GJ56_9CARY|nr:hypothetical protein Cgig2_017996 [Carnegiea gigantea]
MSTRDLKRGCGRVCSFDRVGTVTFGCVGRRADHVRRGNPRSLVLSSSPSLFTLQSSLLTSHLRLSVLLGLPVALSLRLPPSTVGPSLTAFLLRLPVALSLCLPPSTAGGSLSSPSSTGLLPSHSSPSSFNSLALPPTPSPASSSQIPPANFLVSHLPLHPATRPESRSASTVDGRVIRPFHVPSRPTRPFPGDPLVTPTLRGDFKAVDVLVHSGLDVFAHNIGTVKQLQRIVRDPQAGRPRDMIIPIYCRRGLFTCALLSVLGFWWHGQPPILAYQDIPGLEIDPCGAILGVTRLYV